MAGLGKVSEGDGLFLSIAGGYIWNRKAGPDDPDYAEQTYEKIDNTKGVRKGARYGDLTGKIVGVQFRTHDEYGENINVTVDADGDRFIISISTSSRYSQNMMKALLNMDLEKDLFIKPYDFIGKDKKRAMGISFRQGGEKLDLRVSNAPAKEPEWFKEASKKQIKRYFEDLSDWFVAEIEANIIPKMDADLPKTEQPKKGLGPTKAESPAKPADEVKEVVKMSPLKMKKVLREYISENYEGKTLPKLSAEELKEWYSLCEQEEELPFKDKNTGKVETSDIDAELEKLLSK